MVIGLFGACRQKNAGNQEKMPIVQLENGLSLEARLTNPERRLVEVTWKNRGETDLIVTLTKRITWNSDEALSWPYFYINYDTVPKSRTPFAVFDGFVAFGDESVELTEVLKLNGLPLLDSPQPIEGIDWVRLAPGEEISVLFDLGSLFDGIADKNVDSVKVSFRYMCWGREQETDEYWHGILESNSIELLR